MIDLGAGLRPSFTLIFLGAFAMLALQGYLRSRRSRRLRYPPGPKGLPVIGNLLQIPSNRLWEKAVEWETEYGELIYLESLGQRMLIVNSYESAVELLTHKSAIYSSRPHQTMTLDLEGWDWLTVFMPYGNTLRAHRSYQQRFFDSPGSSTFRNVQLQKTHEMLRNILEDPGNYGTHVNSLPGSIILQSAYGYHVQKDDPYVSLAKLGVQYAADAEHFFFLDIFPWLTYLPEWFPFTSFHEEARKAREVAQATKYDLYKRSKQKFAEGNLEECATSIVLSENTREDGTVADEDSFRDATGTLYLAGTDTTGTAIMTFVLQMLKNPEVQRRGQEEVEAVIGTDRLPDFDDMEQLPYVRAICDEVLRVASVVTFVPAHYTYEEDVYKGYRIPANCIVLANAWAMAFNPKYFPEPFAFKPERWLSKDKGEPGPHPHEFAFGFGRRVCPGRFWAENLVFMAISSMLATFNFEKVIGDDGKSIEPNDNYHPSFVRRLGPSVCKITPRSKKVASLIEGSVET